MILLRGWFGVLSTGLDSLTERLRARGINAELSRHLSWYAVVSDVLQERAAGKTGQAGPRGPLQGANNAIAVARSLQAHTVKVATNSWKCRARNQLLSVPRVGIATYARPRLRWQSIQHQYGGRFDRVPHHHRQGLYQHRPCRSSAI